jgi:hypothetical protein
LDWVIAQLKFTEETFQTCHNRPLLWSVENVPESLAVVTESVTKIALLCGSQMGHRVFRHRVFYCNFDAVDNLPHSHKGKWVGSRGVRYSETDDAARYGHLPPPNMRVLQARRTQGLVRRVAWRIGIQSKHVLYQGNCRRTPHLLRAPVVCASDRARPRPRLRTARGYAGSRGRPHWPTGDGTLVSTSGDDSGHGSAPVLVEHEVSDTAVDPDQLADAAGEALRTQVPPLYSETERYVHAQYL